MNRSREAEGTTECIVVDPIRLTDRFAFLEAYRPRVDKQADGPVEDDADPTGKLDPSVPVVRHAPDLGDGKEKISPDLRADVAAALRAFLTSGKLSASVLQSVAVHTTTDAKGNLTNTFMPSSAAAAPDTSVDTSGNFFFERKIRAVEEALRAELGQPSIDLTWLRARMPSVLDEEHVDIFIHEIERVAHDRLATEKEYARWLRDLHASAPRNAETASDNESVAKRSRRLRVR